MNLPIVELNDGERKGDSRADRSHQGRQPLGWVLHAFRLCLVAVIVLGLNRAYSLRRDAESRRAQPVGLSTVQKFLPNTTSLESLSGQAFQVAEDANGNLLALVTSTSPFADKIIGYSGPNDILLVLNDDKQITGAHLLRSGDTVEHAELVEHDTEFWSQFVGLHWGDSLPPGLDGVSGATLTSLAIAEAIGLRIGGERLNLKFPNDLDLEEARGLLPTTASLEARTQHGINSWLAMGENGQQVGLIYRTGTLVDSHEGYQGPSEILLLVDNEGLVSNLSLRESYDNQPYVGYVEQEYSFWPVFKGRSLQDLSELDLKREGIEGVSGATMTSVAVAETIQKSAHVIVTASTAQRPTGRRWNWSWPEAGTALLALASIFWSRSSWRRRRLPRIAWQVLCFTWFGLVTGNLVSLALLSGWTLASAPYRLAPGLATLLCVAMAMPALFRSNVYCDHVCPHGALQQWLRPLRIRRKSPRRRSIAGWIVVGLTASSFGILLLAFCSAAFGFQIPLAWLEPFDSYLWQVGISFSLIVWLLSLVLAIWRPMSYCQLACPTGRVLDTLRRSRRTASSTLVDLCLAGLAVCAWVIVIYQS